MMTPRFVCRRLACLLLLLPAGCEIEYFGHLVVGQLDVLSRLEPVDQAVNDPSLTDLEKSRLALTQHIRLFGIHRIGLRADDSYTVFDRSGPEPAAWILVASEKDSLTPFLWDYFIFGRYSTRGYFDEAYARRNADMLAEMGFDVFLGQAAGFSTLGFFADPIRQSNLQLDEIELAELILHEMLHSTVFKLSDGNFNESMATFVGRTAAQQFFDENFGPQSDLAAAARVRYHDKNIIDAYVQSIFARLDGYYAQAKARGDSRETILAERVAEFDAAKARYAEFFEPQLQDPDFWSFQHNVFFNNAFLLAAIPYQGALDDYQAVFDRVGGSWPDFLFVLNQSAQQEDSRAFLRDFAAMP